MSAQGYHVGRRYFAKAAAGGMGREMEGVAEGTRREQEQWGGGERSPHDHVGFSGKRRPMAGKRGARENLAEQRGRGREVPLL